MKGTLNSYLKQFPGIVLAMLLLCLSSCKEDRADMSSLLSTVPSSAAGVVSINLKAMLQDVGCKVDGKEIKPGKEITDLMKKLDDKERNDLIRLFNGDTGVSPDCAVIFFDSNRCFLTVSLADVDEFCRFFEEDRGSTFTDAGNNVRICENVAVKGAQAWYCLTPGKRIDADAIAAYSVLKNSQSFLSTEMAGLFINADKDIVGWGNIQTVLSGFMSRSNLSILSIGMGFLFEDAQNLSFSVDFEDAEMEAEVLVLNENGKPAKYLLPADKINLNTIEGLGETCDALFAFTVTPKMVSKFEKIGSAIGGTLFSEIPDLLKNIDGTVAAISSNPDSGGFKSINGVITTKGNVSQELKDMISNGIAPVKEDGKMLRFSDGTVTGHLNVKESAEQIKGSCLGVVVDLNGLGVVNGSIPNIPSTFHSLTFSMNPESGGIEFKLVLNGTDSKENILLTILKSC